MTQPTTSTSEPRSGSLHQSRQLLSTLLEKCLVAAGVEPDPYKAPEWYPGAIRERVGELVEALTAAYRDEDGWMELAEPLVGEPESDDDDIPQSAKDKGWTSVGCTVCGGRALADSVAELYKFDGKCRACYEAGESEKA